MQVMQRRQSEAQHGALATLSFGAMAVSSQQLRRRASYRSHLPARQNRQCFTSSTSERVPAVCMSLAIPC